MNKNKRELLANLGLLMITVWAALQYILLKYVPDSVSTFMFIGLTNLIGFIVLALVRFKNLRQINLGTIKKGLLLATELIGFNYFMILGSKNTDPVVMSSILSMYFIFVVPLMLLLRKKVSFRYAIAALIAIISLILLFDVDTDTLFSSKDVIFLLIADIFFAAYVITVSEIGANEDPTTLTLSQMIISGIFGFIGWGCEIAAGASTPALPSGGTFWFCVIFFSILIRALYGVIQVACQKYVKPLNASMIFSSEIIITLLINPIVSELMGTSYTPANIYQYIGSVLFVIALLITDDSFMERFGYNDMETRKYLDENNKENIEHSISKKIINTVMIVSFTSVVLVCVISVYSMDNIESTTIDSSEALGTTIISESQDSLYSEISRELMTAANDRASILSSELHIYQSAAELAAKYAGALYSDPDGYIAKEVSYPLASNTGKWAMQRYLQNETVTYESVRAENELLGNLESVFAGIAKDDENITTIYIGTDSGLLVDYDPNSEYADPGVENYYDYKQTDWYTGGQTAASAFFTTAYKDSYGRGLTITCVAPVYDSSNTFRGCIGIDILVDDMNMSIVNDDIEAPNYALLLDSDGNIIAGYDAGDDQTVNIKDSGNGLPFASVSDEILSCRNGLLSVEDVNRQQNFVAYSYISKMDWILCYIGPMDKVIQVSTDLSRSISESVESVTAYVYDSIKEIIERSLVLIALILIAITGFVGNMSQKIISPLMLLENDVIQISGGNLRLRTRVNTDDEIGRLARAFNHMTDSLQKYIADLKDATAKEERIQAELNIATDIQANMLPKTFPAFPNIKQLDIFASMNPAKEVGGDFYDFFRIDDSHIGLVIADVSGKGVPAALFMVISKTLLKTRLTEGESPATALYNVNNQLCDGNDANLFCTAWAGILDINTGRLVCASAGHEYPAMQGADGVFTLLKDPHGLPLACMENIKYKEYSIQLEKGMALFVYTDGIAEANDKDHNLYGTERLIRTLNAHANDTTQQIAGAVKANVDEFAADTEQFDDITMLCVRYLG